LEGVTEAMIDHALVLEWKSMGDIATDYYLRKALNRRLGTYFSNLADLKAFLIKVRKEKPKENR
jgi:hypothetical protein